MIFALNYILEVNVCLCVQVEEYSLQVSRVFSEQGYKHGDVVALLAGNRPEYVAIWLGLCRMGIITALINTNLRQQTLMHSINISKCKGLIYTSEFADGMPSNMWPLEFYVQSNPVVR
jgi:solute carrier family 27 fatty acid transporter 1/4